MPTQKEIDLDLAMSDIFGHEREFDSSETSEETQEEPTAQLEETEQAVVEPDEVEDASDEEEESTEEESEEEEVSEEDELPSVITVDADGKKVKIDFNNRDHITRVYQKYAAQARYRTERDDYKSKLDELQAAHTEQSDMVNLLNENIENPEEMYALFTGGKNLRDVFKEWQQEEDSFALLSDSEKKAYLDRKTLEDRQKELDKREAAVIRSTEDSEAKRDAAELADQQAVFTSVFEDVRFRDVEDADEQLALDTRLFNDIKMRLSNYEEYNKEVMLKEAKEAAESLRKIIRLNTRREVKKTTTTKKVQAKKAAAKAASTPVDEQPASFMDGLAEAMGFSD